MYYIEKYVVKTGSLIQVLLSTHFDQCIQHILFIVQLPMQVKGLAYFIMIFKTAFIFNQIVKIWLIFL